MLFIRILTIFLSLTFVSLSAQAQEASTNERIEEIVDRLKSNIKKNNFDSIENEFKTYMSNNAETRHGTDITLTAFDHVFAEMKQNISYEEWRPFADRWNRRQSETFLNRYFFHRLNHDEAWHYKNSVEWDGIIQSQRRKYNKTLGLGYKSFYELSKKHPEEWRIHAYLVENFAQYKLNEAEVKEHLDATQKLKPYELRSIKGYLASLTPEHFGRNDDAISKGIEIILKRYPDRNLSRPQLINDEIKQEIEVEIFEYILQKMLKTARQYSEESPKNSAAVHLMPIVYNLIFETLEGHYGENSDKANNHPLSYKRQEVWNEMRESYNKLAINFPESALYLTEYLKTALNLGRLETAKSVIEKIDSQDSDHNPAELRPMQCTYYSSVISNDPSPTSNQKMFEVCKDAVEYTDDEVFLYRTGWAARQIKDYETSNIYLKKALDKIPENFVYLTDVCWNYKDLKRYDKALDYCDKALTLNDKHARAWLGRSHIYFYGFKNIAQSQKDAAMYERYKDTQ